MSKKAKKKATKLGWTDPWMRKRVERTLTEGVSYSANWRSDAGAFTTTAIHWRPPTDPSATLARAIINKVTRHTSPMPLELDGHLYLIQAVDGRLVPNEHGGMEFQPYVPRKEKGKEKDK